MPPLSDQPRRSELFAAIRTTHIALEGILQHMATSTALATCAGCQNVCCREEICRESVEAPFLKFIIGDNAEKYDGTNGWFTPGKGCQTSLGRPLVCYEYFCNAFDGNQSVDTLREASKAFGQCYNNAAGRKHILEVESLDDISDARLESMLAALHVLLASLPAD